MKKINILTIAIVLLALAVPAMADVVTSGEVKYGVCLGPNSNPTIDELTSDEAMYGDIVVTATVDDNNTATVKVKADGNETIVLGQATYVCNLLGAMGLGDIPVEVTLTGGYWEAANADVGVFSGYGVEDVIGFKNETWQFQVDVGIMDMVTIRAQIDPTWAYQQVVAGVENADNANIGYMLGAFGGAGPVMAELFYTNEQGTPADESGDLGIGVGVSLAFGDIGIGVGVNVLMMLSELDDTVAQLGFGVNFTYGTLLSAGIGVQGFIADVGDNSIINKMGINVDVTPIEMITLGIGAIIGVGDNLAYDADTLRQLDIYATTNAGALALTVGYTLTPDTMGRDEWSDHYFFQGNKYDDDADPLTDPIAEGGFVIQAKLAY